MKHAVIILALLLSACGAKDIATLKAKPAIHRTVEAQGDYLEVYERIQAKLLECGPAGPASPMFTNSTGRNIEVPIGNNDGLAFYYSIQDNGNGTSAVEIYSQFKAIDCWVRFFNLVERGALGQPGCP
jgi:hypothetical protein